MKSLSVNAQEFIPYGGLTPTTTYMTHHQANVTGPPPPQPLQQPPPGNMTILVMNDPLAGLQSPIIPATLPYNSFISMTQAPAPSTIVAHLQAKLHPNQPPYPVYADFISSSPIVYSQHQAPPQPPQPPPLVNNTQYASGYRLPATSLPPPPGPLSFGYTYQQQQVPFTTNTVYTNLNEGHKVTKTRPNYKGAFGAGANVKKNFNKNNNNNNNGPVNGRQKFEINDQEWPDLNKSEANATTTSRDKMMTNISSMTKNIMRNAIGQHYMNETYSKPSVRTAASFREAVLAQPVKVKPAPVQVESAPAPALGPGPVDGEEALTTATASTGTKTTKSRRRRSRSSKNKKGSDKASQERGASSTSRERREKTFNLDAEYFPDLNKSKDKLNLSSHDEHSNMHSDAYSSDATLEASLVTNKSTSENDVNKQPTTSKQQPNVSGKKANKPMVIEFANMISALERGQVNHKMKSSSYGKISNQLPNANMRPALNLASIPSLPFKSPVSGMVVRAMMPTSAPTTPKRGKQRENPKAKKKSTLKKIILKEREEKRKIRDEKHVGGEKQSNDSCTSPVSSIYLNELFASPKESNQTDDASENNNHEEQRDDNNDEEAEEENDEQEDENKADTDKEDQVDEEKENTYVDVETVSNQMSPISQGSPISANGYAPSPYTALNVITNDRNLLSLEKLEQLVKQKIHSRKFREYCNQIVNHDIDQVCTALLHEIVRFQDRVYQKNPVKAKSKRRYVMGIREVTKHLKLKKLKCVILAPNCEKIESKGGLDDAINLIIQTSIEQNVPFVFALGRKGLGKAVNKLVPVSVIGLFDYSGAEEYFRRLVDLANNAKLAYQEMIEEYEREECENLITLHSSMIGNGNGSNSQPDSIAHNNPNATNPDNKSSLLAFEPTNTNAASAAKQQQQQNYSNMMPKIPSHMGHSRTPSNGSNISIEPYYHMNYHTHSRSASGNFNYGHTIYGGFNGVANVTTGSVAQNPVVSGHTRSASGGGGGFNPDVLAHNTHHWTHSRTPSNCSNISFISRFSEPISEVGGLANLANVNSSNNTAAYAAVQFYTEQVRQEMRECGVGRGVDVLDPSASLSSTSTAKSECDNEKTKQTTDVLNSNNQLSNGTDELPASVSKISSSLVNLHLGCIDEIDGGNEADTEDQVDHNRSLTDEDRVERKQQSVRHHRSKCSSLENLTAPSTE